MNASIKQTNGLEIRLTLKEYRIFLDFSNDAISISLTCERRDDTIKAFLTAFSVSYPVTFIEIEGFKYCFSVIEDRSYNEVRYHVNINNFLFDLDRQSYVQLHYFLSNMRELKEEEKAKQEPW